MIKYRLWNVLFPVDGKYWVPLIMLPVIIDKE